MLRLLSYLAVALLAGCSGKNTEQIIGHWEAENFQLQGIGLPIGPQLDIDARAIRVSGTEASVPISRMDANGDSVTLVVPAGIDLTFHFARTDRMYIDLPLLGPIYYQRKALGPATTPTATATQTAATTLVVIPPAPVIAAVTAARAASETPATPVAVIPADSPVIVASAATPALVSNAQQSFSRAVILAENNEADAALRQLDDALHEGFRDWAQLDANQALQTLRTDPRYGALMARWRIP